MSWLSKFSSLIQRLRFSSPLKQPLSFLLDWRGFVLLLFFGGTYLLGPPLWDAISVSPQRRVEPFKQRIAELDKRIQTSRSPSTADLKEIATLEKGRIDTEHAIRTTSVQAIAGLFVIITAWIAWKNLQATNEKQIAERFSKGVEQLGNDNIHVRLGGYALEQIAKDDEERYYWQVLETLTSYVRERSPWPPKTSLKHSSFVESVITTPEHSDQDTISPLPDLQAVMTVLARRKHHYQHRLEPHRLDLRKVDLRGLQLPEGAELRGIDFSKANLQWISLRQANLLGAYLFSANLQGAFLHSANLQRVYLGFANLQEANLRQVNLRGADLYKANLRKTEFKNTSPKESKQFGKQDAIGLTWKQVEQAAAYTEELLPDYLLEQRRTASGSEGEK